MKVYILTMNYRKAIFPAQTTSEYTKVIGVFASMAAMLDMIDTIMKKPDYIDFKNIGADSLENLKTYQKISSRSSVTFIHFDAVEKEVLNE